MGVFDLRERVATFTHENGSKWQIKRITPAKYREIEKAVSSKRDVFKKDKHGKEQHFEVVEKDDEKRMWMIFDAAVHGWEDVELLLNDGDGPQAVECTAENKRLVYDYDMDSVKFVMDCMTTFDGVIKEQEEAEVKNLPSGPSSET